MNQPFFKRLESVCESKNSLLCVGMDPQMNIGENHNVYQILKDFCLSLYEKTRDYAACYKPNIAFFEQYGVEGYRAIHDVIEELHDQCLIILDAKRGDIGNTAKAYARGVFSELKSHAVTLSPYLGKESIVPFSEDTSKGLFILCRTSNPGAQKIQNWKIDGLELYLKMADEIASWPGEIGFVVAGNDSEALRAVRKAHPDKWFLAPGIGAQGGSVSEALQAGMNSRKSGILLNVSRGISEADDPGKAAKAFFDETRAAQSKQFTSADLSKDKSLIREIIKEKCFITGQFTLKSGKESPFYIDLRRLINKSSLLSHAAKAYTRIISGLDYKRVAGIPFAGIPIATAVALQLDAPMIFPRLQQKAHGTGKMIEGEFEQGEKIVLIDDLITTGKSKFEALDILDEAGLKCQDLVVLVERGTSGREELKERGVTLHSAFVLEDFVALLKEDNLIDQKEWDRIQAFLEKEG
ncbi:MAG: orotidine-5'-phosphate decarboxylase [Spirochaetales bacterium]|nr:orotidine-5'-phosphate decarboxylase [Spirochaetales bacterium]